MNPPLIDEKVPKRTRKETIKVPSQIIKMSEIKKAKSMEKGIVAGRERMMKSGHGIKPREAFSDCLVTLKTI